MKITGTKSYIDIEHNGRTARFWGDLCLHGFSAIVSTMEWLPPHSNDTVTDEERNTLILEVELFCKRSKNKVVFTDDKGKNIDS